MYSLIEFVDIWKNYNGKQALNGVNLYVRRKISCWNGASNQTL